MSLWIIAERNDSKVYLYCRRGICDLMIMRRYHDITNLLTTPEATLHYCSQHRPATLWLNVLHSASAAACYDARLSHTRTHSPSLSYTHSVILSRTHAHTHTNCLSFSPICSFSFPSLSHTLSFSLFLSLTLCSTAPAFTTQILRWHISQNLPDHFKPHVHALFH